MDHVVWAPAAGTFSHDNGKLSLAKMSKSAERLDSHIPRSFLELSKVTIENPGKSAVSVIGPSLQLVHTGRRKRSVTPSLIDLDEPLKFPDNSSLSTRIEPFDIAVFYFDFRLVLGEIMRQHPRLTVRAQVRVAGRKQLARSPWRRRWKLANSSDSIRDDGRIDAETVIFQALARSRGAWLTESPPSAWLLAQIARKLSGRIKGLDSDLKALANELELVADDQLADGKQIAGSFIAVERAIKDHADRIVWPTQHAPAFMLRSDWEAKSQKREGGPESNSVTNRAKPKLDK